MEFTPVNVINQIMAWFAVTMLETVFIIGDTQVRPPATLRCILGNVVGLIFMMTYFPYYSLAKMIPGNNIEAAMIYLWWGIFYALTILLMMWCFDLSFGQGLFRGIMGLCLYSIGNVIIQHFIVIFWFPNLVEEDMLLYVGINIGVFVALGAVGYFVMVKRMSSMRNLSGLDSKAMHRFLVVLFILSNIVWQISFGIFKHGLEPVKASGEYNYIVASVRYFCGITSIAFSIFVLSILFLFYRISFLRQEEQMLQYLQSEKEKHYEYSRQNMDVINQKCHDLKRQIQALQFSGDTEREKLYQETQSAADFFNYVVKTDNEILNTILTEKGLICHNKQIRLTCTVKGEGGFHHIPVIDLYTILSNALDNAIECVEKYKEVEKKIISVHISPIGDMNCIMIENYFDGTLNFQNGQLMTSKADRDYHGFGVRSIEMLIKKYKGNMRISHVNHTFSLQMMLPT